MFRDKNKKNWGHFIRHWISAQIIQIFNAREVTLIFCFLLSGGNVGTEKWRDWQPEKAASHYVYGPAEEEQCSPGPNLPKNCDH